MYSAHQKLSSLNIADIPSASSYKFAVVVADWNAEITTALCDAAVQTLIDCKAKNENIKIVRVPGSFELVAGAVLIANTGHYDAVICLGCIIQGETRHFEFIATAVANGLANVSIQYLKPVIFGVLTTDTLVQAKERAGGQHGNKGIEAAIAAIKMVCLQKNLIL